MPHEPVGPQSDWPLIFLLGGAFLLGIIFLRACGG